MGDEMPTLTKRSSCAILVLFLLSGPALADALDDVLQRKAIRWGADQEGGGPYIYPSPDDPQRVVGFEVDLMALLARRLGVKSDFHQCEWSSLPSLLQKGDIDAIVNGYELRPEHLATKIATIPYYVYELQLISRRNDPTIELWDDLSKPASPKKKIGVLNGSAAEAYVRGRLGDKVQVRTYEGSTDAMRDVQNGNIDGTVQDLPPALFYRNRFSGLHFVGPPVGKGFYVIYLRKGAERLRDELNAGLLDVIHGGQLRAIYEHYGIWNDAQEQLGAPGLGSNVTRGIQRSTASSSGQQKGPPKSGSEMSGHAQRSSAPRNESDWGDIPNGALEAAETSVEVRGLVVLKRNLPLLVQAAGMSVLLTCAAMPLAIVAGLFVALGRLYGPAPLRVSLTAYVEILRGTPVLLQIFTIYYVIPPALGLNLSPFPAAVLGLALNYSAYESEIYRAGLLAIPVGQMEAALSLGMSKAVALRRIIVPQAVRLVIPPVTNDFIALFKDTSICSVITVVELTKRYQILVNSTNAYLELATVTALLYLLMSYPLSLVARRLERRLPRVVV
jgi:polar amino acid transport system substrate-binding protein